MSLARLLIFVLVLANDSIFTLADNFPNPYPYPYFPDNNNPLYYYRCFDHNLPNPHPVPVPVPPPLPKQQKFLLAFGRGNTIATVVIIVLTLLNIVVFKLRQLQEENSDDDKINVSSSLPSEQLCRRFSLGEILSATHNFDESLVIGKGGFGKVYKGVIDSDTVAIKRLSSMSKQGAPEFWTEIAMLSKCRHSHLVSLIGYCDNYYELVLVYEYMVNGTLADHLYKLARKGNNGSPLSWNQRLKICIGAARGLDYLHTGTGIKHRVIHRDVKSTNILLDENWAAKISDFGLSKTAPANQSCTHVSTLVKGTFGYIDPNYFLTRRLTRFSDVYAFGVVLFEVLCGRPPVDLSLHEDQWGLTGWVQNCIKGGIVDQIIDPNLRGEVFSNCLSAYVQIANQCLHNHPKKRPTMAEVVGWLEFALGLQENRDSSVVEEEIFNVSGPSDSQEHVESSRDQEVINVDNIEHHKEKVDGIKQLGADGKQSSKKSVKKMIFTKKMRSFFLNTARLISVRRDAKTSKNNQSDDYRGGKRELAIIDGCVAHKMPPAGEIVIPNLKIFTFAELKIATSNFRQDGLLGEGGFGRVFKGWVDEKTYAPSKVGIGMAVAVKKYNLEGFQGYKEWRSEVEFLGRYSHPNLVKLLGYCGEDKEILIVYEYMQNGSLENHLFRKGTKRLSWVTRLKIAIGSARGLVFLHTGAETQIIYRDVKASNILLDVDFNAKLSDFGLAKSGPVADRSHVSTRIMGTYGYVAPEYLATGHLTPKSDIYGFGVVLLEILTGLRALDMNRPSGQHNLVDWVKPFLPDKRKLKRIVDLQLLEHDYPPKGVFLLAALTLKCLEVDPRKRPSMKEVLETLEQINALTKDNSTASDK